VQLSLEKLLQDELH